MTERIRCVGVVEEIIPEESKDWVVIRRIGQNVELLSVPKPLLEASLSSSLDGAPQLEAGQIAVEQGVVVSMFIAEDAYSECEMEPSGFSLVPQEQRTEFLIGGDR
jgi:hypothetical protein